MRRAWLMLGFSLLAACAQPAVSFPPRLAEDCGLSERERGELERWEGQQFGPLLALDAVDADVIEGQVQPANAQDLRCELHGNRLEVLPAVAAPGLAQNRITFVQDVDAKAGRFSLMVWSRTHSAEGTPHAHFTAMVGCYLRDEFVPVLACRSCRSAHRAWCHKYLTRRTEYLERFPEDLRLWNAEWRALTEQMDLAFDSER